MSTNLSLYTSLLAVAGLAVAISACAAENEAPAGSANVYGAPMMNNAIDRDSIGATGQAEERTPEQMEQWEKDHPQINQQQEVPIMPISVKDLAKALRILNKKYSRIGDKTWTLDDIRF